VKEPAWIAREECLAIHDMMLAQHGGLAGMRDEGLLESALAKPRNRFGYDASATLAEMAASYAAGIILNHPFLDGNKRTGFMVAVTFLEVNGHIFNASEESVVQNTLCLAAGEMQESAYAIWLGTNLLVAP
jgi:death on curing protein